MMIGRTIRELKREGIKVYWHDKDPDVALVSRIHPKAEEAILGARCDIYTDRIDVDRLFEIISRVRRCEIRQYEDGTRYVWVPRYLPWREAEIIEKYYT